MTSNDVKNTIFDSKLTFDNEFMTSDEFLQIIEAFNFNGDSAVDVEDFKYLKDHISDIDVVLKLIRIIMLCIGKFMKVKHISIKTFTQENNIEAIIKILVFCILYIVVGNCDEFRKWAIVKSPSGRSNGDMLIGTTADIISYIQGADEVKMIIAASYAFLKDKVSKINCSCLKPKVQEQSVSPVDVSKLNVEINSIKSQLNKQYKIHQITKNLK